MPSPFPGMDPYLEDPSYWGDFHDRFLTYLSDMLNDTLPDDYVARLNQRVQVVDRDEGRVVAMVPDVQISRDQGGRAAPQATGGGGAITLEPVTLPLVELDEHRTRYVEIRHGSSHELVTIVELLSPSNKQGTDHFLYLNKRQETFHQDVHLLELDLLLAGTRPPLGAPLPPGDYYAFLSRADRRFTCEVFAWSLRDRLPTLPVPLRSPSPDQPIDLQRLFEAAYDRGRYGRILPYAEPPVAAIPKQHRDWVAERVRGIKK